MKAFKLGSIFGIEVKIDVSWFLIFLLLTYTFSYFYYEYFTPNNGILLNLLLGAVSAILWFFCIFLHELGHSLMAKNLGFNVKEITLFVFGGVSVITEPTKNPKQEFLIAIAGPFVSFALSFLFFFLSIFIDKSSFLYHLFILLTVGNFILGIFNLIPAFPLDGGRILRALLWNRFGELKSTKFAFFSGQIFAYVMMLFGLLYLLKLEFLNGIWLIFLGYFVKISAENNYKQILLKTLFGKYKVEQFMSIIKPAFYYDRIFDIKDYYFSKYNVKTLPVIGKDGNFYALHLRDILNADENLTVKQFLRPLGNCFVSPYESILTAYEKVKDCPFEDIPVIYKNTLLGIIKKSVLKSKINEIENAKEII